MSRAVTFYPVSVKPLSSKLILVKRSKGKINEATGEPRISMLVEMAPRANGAVSQMERLLLGALGQTKF